MNNNNGVRKQPSFRRNFPAASRQQSEIPPHLMVPPNTTVVVDDLVARPYRPNSSRAATQPAAQETDDFSAYLRQETPPYESAIPGAAQFPTPAAGAATTSGANPFTSFAQASPPPLQKAFSRKSGFANAIETVELDCVQRSAFSAPHFTKGHYTTSIQQRMKHEVFQERVEQLNWVAGQCTLSFLIYLPLIILALVQIATVVVLFAATSQKTTTNYIMAFSPAVLLLLTAGGLVVAAKSVRSKIYYDQLIPAVEGACRFFNSKEGTTASLHWSTGTGDNDGARKSVLGPNNANRSAFKIPKVVVRLQVLDLQA